MPLLERPDNARISWEADAPEGGQAVLLIMGLGYPAAMWFRQVPALTERYRVIRVDDRGAGHTVTCRGAVHRGDDGRRLLGRPGRGGGKQCPRRGHLHGWPDGKDALRKLGSVGKPVSTVATRIVDEDMNDVEPGDVGEIVYQGTGLMEGYWNNAEATAEAFAGGWFHSGDLVRMDERDSSTWSTAPRT